MNNFSARMYQLFVGIALLISCVSLSSRGRSEQWTQKMQELSRTLSVLLPDISGEGPINRAQAKRIEAGAKSLMSVAHTIDVKPGSAATQMLPDADPTIRFVSDYFKREVTTAYYNAAHGRPEYARSALRSVTSYCIACHTRHEKGPDFPQLNLNTKIDKLTTPEKAQFFAATRQFDKALAENEKIISDTKIARSRPLEWGNAVRQALTIAVRVKRDPALAGEVLDRILKLPELPDFYRENVSGWLKAVGEWKKEGNRPLNSEEDHYKEGLRLYDKAKSVQQYPLDHSADVYFLRVSLVMHELLSKYPSSKHTSEALWLAGASYDLLENRMMSPLPQSYFEACIRHSPHSDIASRCYRRYEENVHFGFTGSGGESIPTDIATRLKELKTLAMPETKKTSG